MNKTQGSFRRTGVAALIALAVAGGVTYTVHAAWGDPSQSPPNGNVSGPITTGTTAQTKNGSLILSGSSVSMTSPKYCIGTSCITNWSQAGGGGTTYNFSSPLSLSGSTVSLPLPTCGSNEFIRWDGSSLRCAAPTSGGGTTYYGTSPITVAGTAIGINLGNVCNGTNFLQWNGSSFGCGAASAVTPTNYWSPGTVGIKNNTGPVAIGTDTDSGQQAALKVNANGNGYVYIGGPIPQWGLSSAYTANAGILITNTNSSGATDQVMLGFGTESSSKVAYAGLCASKGSSNNAICVSHNGTNGLIHAIGQLRLWGDNGITLNSSASGVTYATVDSTGIKLPSGAKLTLGANSISSVPAGCTTGQVLAMNTAGVITCATPGGSSSWVGTATTDLNMSGKNITNAASITATKAITLPTGQDVIYIGASGANGIIRSEGSNILIKHGVGSVLAVRDTANAGGKITALCGLFNGSPSGDCSSDERLKKDITVIPGALTKLMSIRGVNYTWKDSGEKAHGVIAQDVQKVLPDEVHMDQNGYLTVDYGILTPLLIEAVKEEHKKVESLEARIEALEAKLAE